MRVDAYTFREPADSLVKRLQAATVEDKQAERKAKTFGCITAIAWVGGVFLTFVGLRHGIGWAALLLPAAIVPTVVYVRAKRHDLEDRKLEAGLKFFRILRADIPQNEAVELRIDFRDHRKGGRLVSKEGGMTSPRVYQYEHPWFAARARLADGNELQVSVTAEVTRKEKPKRKYTKVRERWTESVEVVAKLKDYYDAAAIAAALEKSPPPAGMTVLRAAGAGGRVRATFETQEFLEVRGRTGSNVTGEQNRVSADVLLAAVVWFYRGVSGARKSA